MGGEKAPPRWVIEVRSAGRGRGRDPAQGARPARSSRRSGGVQASRAAGGDDGRAPLRLGALRWSWWHRGEELEGLYEVETARVGRILTLFLL